MNANPVPTPRTDAELARLLTDFDLTNIDRREAMAEFARGLEIELTKLAVDANALLRATTEPGDKAVNLILQSRELRRMIEAREQEIQLFRDFLNATADLMKEAAITTPKKT